MPMPCWWGQVDRSREDGHDIELAAPRIVGPEEAADALADDVPRPPRLLRITEFLRMDLAP